MLSGFSDKAWKATMANVMTMVALMLLNLIFLNLDTINYFHTELILEI
jgi:hypothetical protein